MALRINVFGGKGRRKG